MPCRSHCHRLNKRSHCVQVSPNANPNAFYTELVTAPYANNAIISTHVYGPSVTHATTNYSGSGLNWRLSVSFGKKTLTVRFLLINDCCTSIHSCSVDTRCWLRAAVYRIALCCL